VPLPFLLKYGLVLPIRSVALLALSFRRRTLFILSRLCGDLEPLVAKFEQESGRQFELLQVKEKFGGLRIETAVHESFHTCEVCGQPGELREDSWIKTLCDEHAKRTGGTIPR
jgi:hypothetical protein